MNDRAARAVFLVICIEAVLSFPLHLPVTGMLAAVTAGYLCSRVL
jgi:hypothetical protein